jgi:hypothetical protein
MITREILSDRQVFRLDDLVSLMKKEKGKLNKKYAIASIVLIALMCGFLLPMVSPSVRGFDTGPGSPNALYQDYGPRASTLFIYNYGSYAGEVSALESKTTSDYIDTVLTPSDHSTMVSLGGFSFGFITELGIDEVDFNDAFLPFNNTVYRQAISDILSGPSNTEKINFVSFALGAGGGAAAYSPIPGCIQVNSGVPWYDPQTDDLNNGGYDAALTLLIGPNGTSPIFPLATDLVAGTPTGTATWNFSAPYPVSGGLSYNPYAITVAQSEGGSGYGDQAYGTGANGGLEILTRTSDQRSFMGPEVVRMLGANFTWWYLNKATPAEVSAWQNALAIAGLPSTDTPYISCSDPTCTLTQVDVSPGWVMINYCYEMYTAGYSYGFTPDSMLSNYNLNNLPAMFGWSMYHDQTCYNSSTYTVDEAAMEQASVVGKLVSGVPSPSPSALAYCWDAQVQLMGDAAFYPYWTLTGYSPTLTTDNQSICSVITSGTGFNNWWTFLNAYPTTGSLGYATNSLTEGLRSRPLSNVSPITANDYYSWQILPEIYDSLLNNNPYNLSQLIPYLADAWTVGTWFNPGTGQTDSALTFHIRSDVWWQDIPAGARQAITLDNGTELNGPLQNMPFTPLDAAFSMEYQALGYATSTMYIGGGTYEIDHVTVGSMYQSTWDGMLKAYPGNSTDVGFPWANETAVAAALGVTPTSGDVWPLYNLLTYPAVPAPYYTTQQYEEGFVQFNASLDSQTITVYLSQLLPYFGPFRIGGIMMLNEAIYSHIAIGLWTYTLSNGKTWTPVEDTAINYLPPSGSGYDLEYGTGAYVLTSANPTSGDYVLSAYRPGMSYGGITTAHGFFYQPVRDVETSVLGHDPENVLTYKPALNTATSAAVYLTEYVHNYLTSPITVSYYFMGTSECYQTGTWGTKSGFITSTYTVTIPAGATDPLSAPVGIAVTSGWTWVILGTAIHMTYSWVPNPVIGTSTDGVGDSGSYLPGAGEIPIWDSNERNPWNSLPLYDPTYPYEVISSSALAGDIAGASSIVSPYQGADGRVDTRDLTLVTNYWLETVSWAGIYDPTDGAHRADIEGFGHVGAEDEIFFTLQWLKTWSFGTPPTPPSYYLTPIYNLVPPLTTAGVVGITGYKLAFEEAMTNSLDSSATIDYYWSFSVDKWNGTRWISTGISGSSTSVTGYTLPALTTVDLPYYVYVLNSSSAKWGDWLAVIFTFHWTYGGSSYSTSYTAELNVHPGDIAGATPITFPYLGADNVCNLLDVTPISLNWLAKVPPGTDPTSTLARADINGDGVVNLLDVTIISLNWLAKWTIAPPAPPP